VRLTAAILASLALAAALSTSAAASADGPPTLADVEDEVMCPICGTLLELSNAPQAERERALIRRLIDDGRSKEEIKDALVAEYGPDVLAVPDSEGFDLAAWVVPALGLGLAVAVIAGAAFALSRRQRRRARETSELDPGELERLDRDMSSYEL
jgi:cytochrome c-type biogenesis protein CcmH